MGVAKNDGAAGEAADSDAAEPCDGTGGRVYGTGSRETWRCGLSTTGTDRLACRVTSTVQ